MKEIKVDTVTIDGDTEIFGGEIYNVSFKNNFSDAPSNIIISIVNETGIYDIPKLSTRNLSETYQISIGDTDFGLHYLTKTRSSISQSGKVLELTFWDITFNLDKIFIGLHKKHGIIPRISGEGEGRKKSYNKQDILASSLSVESGDERPEYYIQPDDNGAITPLILMGREFHPCDTDLDGFVNLDEDLFKKDGCDPCPDCPEDKYDGSLDRQRCLDLECSEIFEVRYTFKSLMAAVQDFFQQADLEIDIGKLPETNDFYYADYEGTLRDVLRRWGSDFAFNFYIKNIDGEFTIEFMDTRVQGKIIGLSDLKDEDIISYEETQTIENTQNAASISLYRQNGQRKVYECSKSLKLDLKAMTLHDLFADTDDAILGKPSPGNDLVSFEDLEVSMALGKYSESMREAFWFEYMYGVNTSGPLGNSAILEVLYTGPPQVTSSFSEAQSELTLEDTERFPKSTLDYSSGLTESSGLDGNKADTLSKLAKSRGILQLGKMKVLAAFFPESNLDSAEVYYNSGTALGSGPGQFYDEGEVVFNGIKNRIWKPTLEEEAFAANVPIFSVGSTEDDADSFKIRGFGKAYFILASRSNELLEKIEGTEKKLASEFLGKYFAREIDVSDSLNLCGYDKYGNKDFSSKNINLRGGGQFYHFDDESSKSFLENELFGFGHTIGSKVGQLEGRIRNKKMVLKVNSGENVFDQGLVISQISNNWLPAESATNEVKAFLDIFDKKRMREIDTSDTQSTFLKNALIMNYCPEHINDKDVKLFIVYPHDFESGFDIERDMLHPVDGMSVPDTNGRETSSGCYGDCEGSKDCFEGETNEQKLSILQNKLSGLEDQNSTLARAIRREMGGDVCIDGQCRDSNQCYGDIDCGSWQTAGGKTFSEYKCFNGECIENVGLQSTLCTRLSINGFKIFTPPHAFQTPSAKVKLNLEGYNARAFRCILDYTRKVEVFVPKVEHIIQENIEEFSRNYAKLNVNLYQVPISDLNLFYKNGLDTQVCSPSDELLEKLHEEFNSNLSYDIDQPSTSLKVNIAGISKKLDGDAVERGLESFDINLSSNGITSAYVFGNRIMQPVSIDLTRRMIDVLQKRMSQHAKFTSNLNITRDGISGNQV